MAKPRFKLGAATQRNTNRHDTTRHDTTRRDAMRCDASETSRVTKTFAAEGVQGTPRSLALDLGSLAAEAGARAGLAPKTDRSFLRLPRRAHARSDVAHDALRLDTIRFARETR